MECSMVRNEMLEVLYGEADLGAVRRLQEHEAVCGACREEMAALRRLRHDLAQWKLPDSARPRPVPRRSPRTSYLAAAAALLLALGGALGLSGSELRYEQGRLAFRLGRSEDTGRLLAEQESRHRQEIAALRTAVARAGAREDETPPAREALLEKVAEMISASETRQAVLMNARLMEFGERAEAQRRYDLARVSAGLSYLDGKTGQQVARTTELMGYVLQASQNAQKR